MRLTGPLFIFNTPDAHGDIFTAATDFGPRGTWEKLPAIITHGLPIRPELADFAEIVLGVAHLARTDTGISARLDLSETDPLHREIIDLARLGEVGFSAAGGFVRRDGQHVRRFFLHELSIVPNPASAEYVRVETRRAPVTPVDHVFLSELP